MHTVVAYWQQIVNAFVLVPQVAAVPYCLGLRGTEATFIGCKEKFAYWHMTPITLGCEFSIMGSSSISRKRARARRLALQGKSYFSGHVLK